VLGVGVGAGAGAPDDETIKRVFIDVSGKLFEDLAREARAAFAHQ
jgi:hypothetical protein